MRTNHSIKRFIPHSPRVRVPQLHWAILATYLALTHLALAEDPVITLQPADQIVSFGGTASFKVAATSTNGLSYQWQREDLSVPGAFTNLHVYTVQLKLYNVSAEQGGDYRVIVADASGNSVTSQVARLILVPVAITLQPTNQTVSLGATVQFRASGSTADYPITNQWQHTAINFPEGFTNLPAGTKNLLTLTNVVAEQAGDYRIIVANALGNSATSQVATLTVDATFTKITTGPLVENVFAHQGFAWVDYDNDGWLDVCVTRFQSTTWLYHNNRDGTFVPQRLSSQDAGSWYKGTWGDYNNDGNIDVFFPNWATYPNRLFLNQGDGKFSLVTGSVTVTNSAGAIGAGWSDYDRDGYLDLFVAYGPSWSSPANDRFFHNRGDGTFEQLSEAQIGPAVKDGSRHGNGDWIDFNNDGRQELFQQYVDASPLTPIKTVCYQQNAQGLLMPIDVGIEAWLSLADLAWGDYDNDGWMDCFAATYTNTVQGLYRNLHGQGFTNIAESAGLNSWPGGNQAVWGDYDNDGWLDLFVMGFNYAALGPMGYPSLWHNNGNGTFTRVEAGSPVTESGYEGCVGWGDYDNDGFLDLLITRGLDVPQVNRLYRNNGNSNGWLKVKLNGTRSNRLGMGAKVRVQATIRSQVLEQTRELGANHGFNLNNLCDGGDGFLAHFGLGDATKVNTLRIEWPSGTRQEIMNVATNQFVTVWEPPVISADPQADGACVLNMRAEPDRGWRIQASTDLATWQTITTITNAAVEFQYTDAAASRMSWRFYRVLGN
jgi:hypothetical protein